LFESYVILKAEMSIGTRDYARPYVGGGGLPYAVKWLLIANIAVFLLQNFGLGTFFEWNFALWPAQLLSRFAVWQLISYAFLHSGIMHILFNMLALWMFGRELEGVWGSRTFFRFYFACAVGAGICVALLHFLSREHPLAHTVGASGAVYGILLASAMMWPDRLVYIYAVLPVKMKHLVIVYGAISFIGLYQGGGQISHIGHLGGLLSGWIFMKTQFKRRSRGPSFSFSLGDRYKAWKLERNKRKFQVYLKKHGSDRDPWVN
jgi:membrane associated rhomboid family serine protease